MRLAKPINNPTPTSIAISPTHPQRSRACASPAGKAGLTNTARNTPSASRNCTGKLGAEKIGKTANMALTRRKTISPVVSSLMVRFTASFAAFFQ